MSTNQKKRIILWSAVFATLVALGTVSYVYGELWLRTYVWNFVKASTPAWVLGLLPVFGTLLLGSILFGIAAFADEPWDAEAKKTHSVKVRKTRIVATLLVVFGSVNLLVPGVGLLGSKAWRNGHESLREIATNVSESTENHPEYLVRPNSVQANRIALELLNDVSVSATTPAQYTRANGKPAWCLGGMGRSDRFGRKYTTQVVCIDDENTLSKAAFNGLIPSIDGNFSTNLRKKIAESQPGLSVALEDVRFMIKDGKPLMILPATFRRGGMNPITLPAGVFVYDVNGALTYDKEATSGEYDIAVLPYKVARDLRASLNERAGYWCAGNLNKEKCLKRNTPYEATNVINGEKQSDVNSENYSEFVLYRADGSIAMVTPLTNYGKGRNITAYFEVPADAASYGVLPKATLYKGVNEVSHRVIVQALTPAYTSDLTWLTEIDASADQATASRIYEITPTEPGSMRLTIGTSTNPQYIVDVKATLSADSTEFSWCIYTAPSGSNASRKIECRKASDGEAPIGTLRGLNLGTQPTTPATTPVVDPSSDLATLSNEELLQLIKEASEELARR